MWSGRSSYRFSRVLRYLYFVVGVCAVEGVEQRPYQGRRRGHRERAGLVGVMRGADGWSRGPAVRAFVSSRGVCRRACVKK
jgi:hypothetical protein